MREEDKKQEEQKCARQPRHMKSHSRLMRRKDRKLLLLALPAIILIFIFNYMPMAGIVIAFKNVNFRDGILKSPWVGLKNFRFFFESSDAGMVTRNTLCYNILFIVLGTAFALMFAIMLNEVVGRKRVKAYQTIFFFPYFFSWVVVAYMLYSFIGPKGIITSAMAGASGQIKEFYTTPRYWPFILTFVYIWKSVGYNSVIYYAGIMGISSDYYEAAAIDGATRWQMIRHITLPLLRPIIIMLTLLAIGKIFYSDFGLFFFVPRESGVLYPVTQVIDTYVFRMLRSSGDLGMSAAAGLYQSVMGFILVLLSNAAVKRIDPDYSMF